MHTGRTVLIAVEMLTASVWVGSMVCLALGEASVARRTLDAASPRRAVSGHRTPLTGVSARGRFSLRSQPALRSPGGRHTGDTIVTVALSLSVALRRTHGCRYGASAPDDGSSPACDRRTTRRERHTLDPCGHAGWLGCCRASLAGLTLLIVVFLGAYTIAA